MFTKKTVLILVVLLCFNFSVAGQKQPKKEKIFGTIVAYTEASRPITFAPGSQTLVVKVDQRRKSQVKDQYVLISYVYFDEPILSEEMLKGNREWKFIVTRDERYDLKIKEISVGFVDINTGIETSRTSRLNWVSDVENEIPADKVLSAYELKSGDYKLVKN